MDGKTEIKACPGGEYKVIQILELEKGKVYVTNQWHAEHRKEPLSIIESLVKRFIKGE